MNIKLQIEKIHGHYNYNISFNSDVTFLYGENGCGKTTVLHILGAILTGQLQKLFNYSFQRIVLEYTTDKARRIVITREEDKITTMLEGRLDKDLSDDIKETFNSVYMYRPLVLGDELDSFEDEINGIISAAEKAGQQKASIEKFLATMNEFINTGEDPKELKIDSKGQVYFKTKYSEYISIQHLSSGEKQLLTIFANLIFNVKSDTHGVFIVDTPETSLHLSWQKILVEKMLEINNNVQLIFATHSPEIIGKNRDKMIKLVKRCVE